MTVRESQSGREIGMELSAGRKQIQEVGKGSRMKLPFPTAGGYLWVLLCFTYVKVEKPFELQNYDTLFPSR